MPDQSSAADEHALIQEITSPLSTLPDDPVAIAADVDFPIVLRGYDRLAVDDYVKRTSQLVAELQATRSPEAAVRRALERVGEQVSGILQRAHETTSQITAQSRREAEDRLEVAREEATQISAAAEQRLRELDADTDRIWAERARIVEDARQLARELVALADSAAEQFPAADTGSLRETEESPPTPVPGSTVDDNTGEDAETVVAQDADREDPTTERTRARAYDWPEAAEELEGEVDPDATAAFSPVEPEEPGGQPPHRPDASSGP